MAQLRAVEALRARFAPENVFVWLLALGLGASSGAASILEPDGLVTGLTLLGAAVIASIAVANDAFRRIAQIGIHTSPGKKHALVTIGAVAGAPLIVVITAVYLPWIDRVPAGPRAFVFGVTAAALGGVILSMAIRPIRELDAVAAAAEIPPDSRTAALPPGSVGGLLSFDVDEHAPFDKDRLGQRAFVENFSREVATAPAPTLWALDGAWGSGKTAVVQMSEAHLRNEGIDVAVFTPAVEGLTGTPLTDLLVALTAHLARESGSSTDDSLPEHVLALWYHGTALGDPRLLLSDSANRGTTRAPPLLAASRLLRDHVERSGRRLVVWIDELDRCEPRYALEMLQGARALLHIPDVITLIAVNKTALRHGVETIHGAGTGDRFLDRYIDRTVPLGTPGSDTYDHHQLFQQLVKSWAEAVGANEWAPHDTPWSTLAGVGVATDLSIRDVGQIVAEFAVIAQRLPSVESYMREPPMRYGRPQRDPLHDAHRRRGDTNLAVLALLVLRRYAPHDFATHAAQAGQLEPTSQNWLALLGNAGATVQPDQWPGHPADGGIMYALANVLKRDPRDAPTFADLVAAVNGQPAAATDGGSESAPPGGPQEG